MKKNLFAICLTAILVFISQPLSADFTYWTYGNNPGNCFEGVYYSSGNFITAGTYTGLSKDFSYFKLNSSGQIITNQFYGENTLYEVCNFFTKEYNSNTYILGGVASSFLNNKSIYVVRIDSDGNLICENYITDNDPGDDEEPGAEYSEPGNDEDGYCLLIGTRTFGMAKNIFIYTLNSDLSERMYTLIPSDENQEAFGIEKIMNNTLENNRYIIVGSSDGKQYIMVFNYCEEENFEVETDVVLFDGCLNQIIESQEGKSEYFYSCGYSESGGRKKMFLVKFQIDQYNNIDTLWSRTIEQDTLYNVVANDLFQYNNSCVYTGGVKKRISDGVEFPYFFYFDRFGNNPQEYFYPGLPNTGLKGLFSNTLIYFCGYSGNSALFARQYPITIPDNIENAENNIVIMGEKSNSAFECCISSGFITLNDGSASVHFSLSYGSSCILDIFNITGSRVKTIHAGQLSVGDNSISFTTKDLPKGIYFARISTANASRTLKFVLTQ
ncbi:T9SS type A sorting domain-containing protein [candidate division WOR-3 bacterium]|nr:T9SS type A sorting domain-containing protein [candidate division WOR-3 bacterium]